MTVVLAIAARLSPYVTRLCAAVSMSAVDLVPNAGVIWFASLFGGGQGTLAKSGGMIHSIIRMRTASSTAGPIRCSHRPMRIIVLLGLLPCISGTPVPLTRLSDASGSRSFGSESEYVSRTGQSSLLTKYSAVIAHSPCLVYSACLVSSTLALLSALAFSKLRPEFAHIELARAAHRRRERVRPGTRRCVPGAAAA